MDSDLTLACALAKALIAGKDSNELARMQILLQTVSSLVSAELGCLRLKNAASSEPQSKSGTSQ